MCVWVGKKGFIVYCFIYLLRGLQFSRVCVCVQVHGERPSGGRGARSKAHQAEPGQQQAVSRSVQIRS